MADGSESRKRRALELNERDEELDDTPKYADAETMAQRRIARVKRAPTIDAPPSLKGAFKAVAGISPAGAPALSKMFGPSDSSNNATTATTATGGSSDTSPGASNKNDNSNNNNNNKTTDGAVAAGTETGAGRSLFGGAFNFGGATNAFAAAKEQLAKAAVDAEREAPPHEKLAKGDVLAHAAPVTPSAEDVLACVSCKLFVFKSDTKSWVECGAGDAKVKRHDAPKAGEGEEVGKCRYRLIVRDGYALNLLLCSNFHLTKAEDTHVIFTVPKNDGVATYLVKYTGQQAAARGAEFTKTLKDSLKLSQDNSS
ncbi:uncharacterized protein Tco025E_02665 [Trypanosoma conorhini]|uniref:RanBD1 domain-containing protein n=1 Tax=Trypanosoma conorhini TaxID=83891 RepID=A0A422Q1W6_9TRYP|nr:uncharacterized protein Tco025E_02665 [Trypanosoma conorhini]RNF23961.1 hypothetical protein Tco025E_02665 [Trypanosoma conorhini]